MFIRIVYFNEDDCIRQTDHSKYTGFRLQRKKKQRKQSIISNIAVKDFDANKSTRSNEVVILIFAGSSIQINSNFFEAKP